MYSPSFNDELFKAGILSLNSAKMWMGTRDSRGPECGS